MRKHIFNAGPSILPLSVLEKSSEAIKELDHLGLSILEFSHRGKEFTEIIDEAKQLVKSIYGLSDNYEVLFLQGGASTQFCMIPFNFLNQRETAAYIDTGVWSSKAIKEAQYFGEVNVVASSKEANYSYIPQGFEIPSGAKYLHLTSNNTIYGTQFHKYPESEVPAFVDMSSDIFSKKVDLNQFDFIYAGAQKNLGPAGATLVILKNELLDKIDKQLPSMMDYRVHVSKESLFNTPPVFAIYVCLLTLRWISEQGGLEVIEQNNNRKAEKLYQAIDKYPLFVGTAKEEDRSKMNVTFVLKEPELENELLELAQQADIIGIKGYRTIGGFRASIYNALPLESVDVLVDVMQQFAEQHG